MKTENMLLGILVILALVAVGGAINQVSNGGINIFGAGGSDQNISIPIGCPEDAVLMGMGEYENGRFENYACGPAVDDFYTIEPTVTPTPDK